MADITLRHELECTEDIFWNKVFFDEEDEFNKYLYNTLLKFPKYEVLELRKEEGRVVRRARVEPPVGGVPLPIKKILGDRLAYNEEGVFDAKTKRYTIKVTPSALPDKTRISGEIYCEKLGEKRIARIAKFTVEVKVFGVGGLVEGRIISDLKKSYDTAAQATNVWLKEKGL